MSYPINDAYKISTTKTMWSPMPGHNRINVTAWQLMNFLSQIPSIWCLHLMWFSSPIFPALSLTKYYNPNWVRPLVKFNLFRSSLLSIIKMIILSLCFRFLISHTKSSMNNIIVQYTSPTALWYHLCWTYTFRYIIKSSLFQGYRQFTAQGTPEYVDSGTNFEQLPSQNMWTWLKYEEKRGLDSFLD